MGHYQLLKGLRVIDFSRDLAGPLSSQLLGDLGVEVIKIEPSYIGDDTRPMYPYLEEGMSYYFVAVNRNKKSVTLDLLTPSGKEVFYDLVKISDVVYDKLRKGVLKRLGGT